MNTLFEEECCEEFMKKIKSVYGYVLGNMASRDKLNIFKPIF